MLSCVLKLLLNKDEIAVFALIVVRKKIKASSCVWRLGVLFSSDTRQITGLRHNHIQRHHERHEETGLWHNALRCHGPSCSRNSWNDDRYYYWDIWNIVWNNVKDTIQEILRWIFCRKDVFVELCDGKEYSGCWPLKFRQFP